MSNEREFYRLIHRAYIRDGKNVHEGEALLLACILHTHGKSRESDDMIDVQRLMRDRNLKR